MRSTRWKVRDRGGGGTGAGQGSLLGWMRWSVRGEEGLVKQGGDAEHAIQVGGTRQGSSGTGLMETG